MPVCWLCLWRSPMQPSVYCIQPERAGREDQRGEVPKNPVPILWRAEHLAQQNAQLEGYKWTIHHSHFVRKLNCATVILLICFSVARTIWGPPWRLLSRAACWLTLSQRSRGGHRRDSAGSRRTPTAPFTSPRSQRRPRPQSSDSGSRHCETERRRWRNARRGWSVRLLFILPLWPAHGTAWRPGKTFKAADEILSIIVQL